MNNEKEEGGGVNPQPELNEAQKAYAAAQAQRVMIRKGTEAASKELHEVIVALTEAGYQNWSYEKGSEVTIPGSLFAHLIHFTATINGHNDVMKEMLLSVIDATDAITMSALEFQAELTKKHKTNCEEGICTTPEEKEALEAEATKNDVAEVKEPTLKVVKTGKAMTKKKVKAKMKVVK